VRQLETYFHLSPGSLTKKTVEELFQLVVGELRWVRPSRYGKLSTEESIRGGDAVPLLAQFFGENGIVVMKGKGGELLLAPNRGEEQTTTGFMVWFVAETAAAEPRRRARHVDGCTAVAKLLRAPLAWAGLDEDHNRRKHRIVPAGRLSQSVPRLRGYHDGLLGLYWQNFFGPPFTAMFADRLRELPAGIARDLGDGYWLVQPYETPDQALTEEGRQREIELIRRIGSEFFYDMEREQPPTRRPIIRMGAGTT
jgi:hypothetical protein